MWDMSTPQNPRSVAPPEHVPCTSDPPLLVEDPPDRHQLEAATSRLPRCSALLASLHLALPVDEVPTTSLRLRAGSFLYRGLSVHPAPDPWRTAARVAAVGHRSSDRYLDLSDEATPVDWVKLLRSGGHLMAFGSDYLLGAPQVLFDPLVPRHVATALLSAMLDPTVPLDLPTLNEFHGVRLLVSGDPGRLTVIRA